MTARKLTVTDMARMALCEAGRPDLAVELEPNRIGHPMIGCLLLDHPDDVDVACRAVWLAHTAAGTLPSNWPWVDVDDFISSWDGP